MSTIIKSDDDCFFFFTATCTKGEACPYRHSTAAYGSDVVCSFWREGNCVKGASCKYRHMEVRKQRNKVECFFERQPGGCKKPYCPFLHKSSGKAANDEGSGINNESVDIHSTSSEHLASKNSSFMSDQEYKGEGDISSGSLSNVNEILKPCATPPFSPTSKQPGSPSSTAATICSEPVSFNIDIAEESENEPEEIGNLDKKSVKLTAANQQSGKNFGVKTLEQIRMEKVFKSNDVNKESISEPSNPSKVSRIKLKRKSLSTTNNSNTTIDCPVGLKTSSENESKLVFAVKSLDEIRREKDQLQLTPEQTSTETETNDAKPKKIIKIKRSHLGINKPDEPPSKIVKLRKPVCDDSPFKPLTKCNLTETLDKPVKVQSPDNPPPRLQQKPVKTPSPIKSMAPKPSPPKLGPVSSSPVSSTPIAAVTPQKQSQPSPTRVLIKPDIQKISRNVPKQLNETEKSNLSVSNPIRKTQPCEQKSPGSNKKRELKSPKVMPDPSPTKYETQVLKKSKISSSPSHDESKWNDKLCEKTIVKEVEEINLLQKDEDFLEEDDLLADENGETAPEDVNIEDEDDEFLKEIEHVINS